MEWPCALTAVVFSCYRKVARCILQDGGKAGQLDQKIVEAYFVFACIWAFGGCLAVEKTADHRAQFSQYWVMEWKTVTFPDQVRCILHCNFTLYSKPRLESLLPLKLVLAIRLI